MSTPSITPYTNALRIGLIAGIIGIYISLTGMVEAFNGRDIIAGVLSLGETLVLMVFLLFGYLTAARTPDKSLLRTILASLLTGFVAAVILSIMVVIINNNDLRTISGNTPFLVNASKELVNILTLGKGLVPGLFYLMAIGMLFSLFGALIDDLPERISKPVMVGLASVVLVGSLQETIELILVTHPTLDNALSWMFGTTIAGGLTWLGALVVFSLAAGINYLMSIYRPKMASRPQSVSSQRARMSRIILLSLLAVALAYYPWFFGTVISEISDTVGLFILMGLGLNIVVGFAGLLDLGYVAFFAIGAYTIGVLTNTSGELVWSFGWTFWMALPVAILVATLTGVLLGVPVLRMRGDYLAIVTLGFGEIIRILALSDWLKPYIGGSQGIVLIPPPVINISLPMLGIDFTLAFDTFQKLYYLIVAGILVCLFIARRLRDSRMGRSWKALREDEDVAQAMGINLVLTKLLAFATGAAFAGLAGAFLAPKLGTIYPHSFQLLISINVLALIIVGGIGSIPGVLIGAVILVGLPELLREFDEYRLLIYGALLVIMMQLRPAGFWPESTHKRELQEAPSEASVEANV